jgi:alpha-acetolactate decarboxylase
MNPAEDYTSKTGNRELAAGVLKQVALTDEPREMRALYQISTSAALVEGVYSGSIPSSVLLEHGDFGLGTFEGLDGEMVILDGQIYQVADRVRHRTDDFPVPFASITHFRAKPSFEIDNFACLKDIELACDQQRISDNLFYALRLDGIFETIHARAVHTVPQNTRLLDAAKTQSEFHFENIEGTLVGFWSRATRVPSVFRDIIFTLFPKTEQEAVICWIAAHANSKRVSRFCRSSTFSFRTVDLS